MTPSGLVMTRLPVPVFGDGDEQTDLGDQHTPCQLLSAADVRLVQVTPSGLVMTRSPVPVYATATNNPTSDYQHTLRQLLSAAEVRLVQVTPSGLVMTRSPVPVFGDGDEQADLGTPTHAIASCCRRRRCGWSR